MSETSRASLSLDANFLWDSHWNAVKTRQTASTGQEEALWRAGGRATKENPNKEDGQWWDKNGRQMVQNWIDWRDQSHGLQMWTTPNGEPAIELVVNISLNDVPIKMALDRVMVTQAGELVVVDLKTGKNTPSSDFQLGIYAVGMEIVFGNRPKYGTYWSAREGKLTELKPLDRWSIETVTNIVTQFDKARREGIFVPNFDHCKMCNFVSVCKYQQGEM